MEPRHVLRCLPGIIATLLTAVVATAAAVTGIASLFYEGWGQPLPVMLRDPRRRGPHGSRPHRAPLAAHSGRAAGDDWGRRRRVVAECAGPAQHGAARRV